VREKELKGERHLASMGIKKCIQIFGRTKQLDRHTCRWKDDMANSLKERGWKDIDLTNLP
jgi:hypothetical protein